MTTVQLGRTNTNKLVQLPINPTNHSAQQLFKDGLLTIFTYLTFDQLAPVGRACHRWSDAVRDERPRGIILSPSSVELLCIPLHSMLAHHITQLVCPSDDIAPLTNFVDFAHLLRRLPGLQSVEVRMSEEVAPVEPIWMPHI